MKQARYLVEKQLFTKFGNALERAPWKSCRLTGTRLGLLFFYGLKKRRIIAMDNVRLAFPNLTDRQILVTARNSAQNFGMSFCEFMHLPGASKAEMAEYCSWQNGEYIESALAGGKGMVLPTAHFGAWEVTGARAASEYDFTVMVRLTSDRALKEHISKIREEAGIKIILKDESARASLKALHDGGILALFPDQHAGPGGTMLPIFSHPTSVFTSPSRLALRAGSPIVPVYGVRRTPWIENGHVDMKAFEPLQLSDRKWESREDAVLAGTKYIIETMESVVRENRDQWLWMHRRWRPEDNAAATGVAATAGAPSP